jgi:hypothetical protein
MFSPWRNRTLIDYCQAITEGALLLRSSGAPFLGEGEKYFSVIDDTEIEIMKALWEGAEDYMKIPTARRVWGTEWVNKKEILEAAKLYAEASLALVDSTINILPVPILNRGVFVMLAIQAKRWERIEVETYYQLAADTLIKFCTDRVPELKLDTIIKFNPEGKQ